MSGSTIKIISNRQISPNVSIVKVKVSKEFECIVTQTSKGLHFYYLNASAPRNKGLFEYYYAESIK